jgi:hypothetical protein
VVVEPKAEDKELAPITAQQLAEDIHTNIPLAMMEEEVEATASQFRALQLLTRPGHVDEDREIEVRSEKCNAWHHLARCVLFDRCGRRSAAWRFSTLRTPRRSSISSRTSPSWQ